MFGKTTYFSVLDGLFHAEGEVRQGSAVKDEPVQKKASTTNLLEAIYQDVVRLPDNVVSIEAKEPEHGRAETSAENHGNALDAVVSG